MPRRSFHAKFCPDGGKRDITHAIGIKRLCVALKNILPIDTNSPSTIGFGIKSHASLRQSCPFHKNLRIGNGLIITVFIPCGIRYTKRDSGLVKRGIACAIGVIRGLEARKNRLPINRTITIIRTINGEAIPRQFCAFIPNGWYISRQCIAPNTPRGIGKAKC